MWSIRHAASLAAPTEVLQVLVVDADREPLCTVPAQRGLERIVRFADAVVAIACTLLVLPLVDLAGQGAGVHVGRLLSDHIGQFEAFALSFAVIARLWVAHHRLFEGFGSCDTVIIWLTLLWLFTVAFLPFPTAILAIQSGRGASMLYIGTPLLSSMALWSTSTWVSAHRALRRTVEPGAAVDEPHWTTAALRRRRSVGRPSPVARNTERVAQQATSTRQPEIHHHVRGISCGLQVQLVWRRRAGRGHLLRKLGSLSSGSFAGDDPGPGTALTPLGRENPLRPAEDLAKVDVLSGGRIDPAIVSSLRRAGARSSRPSSRTPPSSRTSLTSVPGASWTRRPAPSRRAT